MNFRQLGKSGLTVSVVGLGANNFGGRLDLERTRAVVDAALDMGINLIDTADIYGNQGGSEDQLGQVLIGRRDDVVLATKFGQDMGDGYGPARGSRRYIRRAVEASLKRLRTDYIDLYQYHTPDNITPLDETLAALDELVQEGKVRYIGSSNLTAWQVVDSEWIARTQNRPRFISAQNHYSLLERDAQVELLPACERVGVGVLPYFPLAQGLLTGKHKRGQAPVEGSRVAERPHLITDEALDKVEALEQFAAERDHTVLELAFAGLLAQPSVSSVIAGATKPDQIKANVSAGEWTLTPGDVADLKILLDR